MTSPIEKTLALLDLEKIDKNVFSWQGENFGWHRIYGGQVMAQSLIAAYQTIEKKHFAHSFLSILIFCDLDSLRIQSFLMLIALGMGRVLPREE